MTFEKLLEGKFWKKSPKYALKKRVDTQVQIGANTYLKWQISKENKRSKTIQKLTRLAFDGSLMNGLAPFDKSALRGRRNGHRLRKVSHCHRMLS